MTEILKVASHYHLKVIEDSCEAMFVRHNGQMVGSMGDIGCFSTYVAHILVTGVGGMGITNNPAYAAKMRSLINHGLEMQQMNPDENFAPRPMLGRRFIFTSHGHSSRGTDFQAALGLAQLEEYPTMLRIRRRNAAHLYAGLKIINKHAGDPFVIPTLAPSNEHAWMMAPILLRAEGDVYPDKTFLTHALNEAGIETRDLPSILGQPIYALNPTHFPVSAWLWRSGFYVGSHQALTPDDMQYIIETLDHNL
jgi:dTDP-4-amino-4,6-dideoxygalactose transaminase